MNIRMILRSRASKTLSILICLSMMMTGVSFASDLYWKENHGIIPASNSNLQAAPFDPTKPTETATYTEIGCGGDEEESRYNGGCDGYFTDTKQWIFGQYRVVKRVQTNPFFYPSHGLAPGEYVATYEYKRDADGRVYGSKSTIDTLPRSPGRVMFIQEWSLTSAGRVYLSKQLAIVGSQAIESLYGENGGLISWRNLVKDANGNFVLPSALLLANVPKPDSDTANKKLKSSNALNSNAQLIDSRFNKIDVIFFKDKKANDALINLINSDPFSRSFFNSLSAKISLQSNISKVTLDFTNFSGPKTTISYASGTSLRAQLLNKSGKNSEDGGLYINTNASAASIENTPIRTGELSVADIMDMGNMKLSFDMSNMDEVSVHGANLRDQASPMPRGPNAALTDVNLIMSTNTTDDSKESLSTLNEKLLTSHLDSRVALLGSLNANSSSTETNTSSTSSSMTMDAYLSGTSPVSKSLDRLLKKNPSLSIDAMMMKLAEDPASLDQDGGMLSSYQWADLYSSTAGKHLPVVAA